MRNELVILRTIRNAQASLELALSMIEDTGEHTDDARYGDAYSGLDAANELMARACRKLPR